MKTTDRYGRSIAEITRGGRNINQALVASRAAFVYWQYIKGCDRQTYSRLETEARLKGLGVWSTGRGITRTGDPGCPASPGQRGSSPRQRWSHGPAFFRRGSHQLHQPAA
nr:thermonuclease family protein [Synechococcus sp. WH 8101]